MPTSKENRVANLKFLIAEMKTAEAVAAASGTAPMYLSQVLNGTPSKTGRPRGIGDAVARKLEQGCGKPVGWMDQDHDDDPRKREIDDLFTKLDDRGRETLLAVARGLLGTAAQAPS